MKSRVPFAFSGFCSALLSAALFSSSVSAQFLKQPDLEELDQLSSAGMSHFALVLLEQNTPNLEESTAQWIEWQKHKVAIYQQQGSWLQIVQIKDVLPENVPPEFADWLNEQIIDAYLKLGDGEAARDLLLPLLWETEQSSEKVRLLRHKVVSSYLVEGRNDDAQSARLRFEQDYPTSVSENAWRATKGRLLLVSGDTSGAAISTVANESPEAQAVHFIAKLKSYAPLDAEILTRVLDLLASQQLDQELRLELFSVVLNKAAEIESWPERIEVLEKLSAVGRVSDARMAALADALWFAYAEYGHELVNRLQLLRGDYQAWFDSGERLLVSSRVQGVSLFAYMALRLDESQLQSAGHEKIVMALEAARKEALISLLYLGSSQFAQVDILPAAVVYRLIDVALTDNDLALASKLMSQIAQPEGGAGVDWLLRRVRVQIKAGVPDYGVDSLQQLVSSYPLSSVQVEYLIEIVFDLQNNKRHQNAYDILNALLPNVPDLMQHREVLYLMADSLMSMQQYAGAARLFLRSALLDSSSINDSWGQAARYQAAQAMLKLGLVDDALGIYRDLYALAENPQRRASLQREIQLYSLR